MVRAVLIVVTVFILLLQSSLVIGSRGQVLKVIDGDTFMMEVDGATGPEQIEVNLRCSDAPIINAPFGKESSQYLESLLSGEEIHFKVQAYCGSAQCVEVLAYIPDPDNPQTTYINTRMIAAGMARNDSCRGVFNDAELSAKEKKIGIWSTSKKITFAESVKPVDPEAPTKTTKKQSMTALNPKAAPALIEVDRAERTVTLKSTAMPISKAIKAIDTVSTLPVSLYLIEEQRIPLSLDNRPWYTALQYIVEKANLKQVNMNGKIDLYDQLFYYKHIAPHLKLSDSDGVYIKAGSGVKTPVADDGVTRYVFINDFENSAALARQKAEDESGFVQVHKGSSPAPVSNYGRFEVTEEQKEPDVVASAETVTNKMSVAESSSKQDADVDQKNPTTAVEEPAAPVAVAAEPTALVKETKEIEQAAVATAAAPKQDEEARTALPAKPVAKETTPAKQAEAAEPVLNIELDRTELTVLLVVVVVVLFGSLLLSRSAARRAAKAEKSVNPATLGQKFESLEPTSEPAVDKEYEQKVFEDIDHLDETDDAEKVVDDIFRDSPTTPVKSSPEESHGSEEVFDKESADKPVAEVKVEDDVAPDKKPEEAKPKAEQQKPAKKKVKGAVIDEGNYAVTLDDYDRLMNPPKREPRTDCLFEVTCSHDGTTTTGIGLDISSGGIFIDSKDHFGVGKVLDLTFKLQEEDDESIRCRGAVTWVNERPDPIKPNYPNGFGVHFIDVDPQTAQTIAEFLHPEGQEASDGTEDDI